jgi:ketopantoate hydroxymethyltransferase
MVEGNFTASVKAVNKMYLRSIPVTKDISVSPAIPHLTGKYLVVGKTNYILQITIK